MDTHRSASHCENISHLHALKIVQRTYQLAIIGHMLCVSIHTQVCLCKRALPCGVWTYMRSKCFVVSVVCACVCTCVRFFYYGIAAKLLVGLTVTVIESGRPAIGWEIVDDTYPKQDTASLPITCKLVSYSKRWTIKTRSSHTQTTMQCCPGDLNHPIVFR